MTTAQTLRDHADRLGIPLRTLADVQAALAKAKVTNADKSMARLMLAHGRLTDEARAFVEAWQ